MFHPHSYPSPSPSLPEISRCRPLSVLFTHIFSLSVPRSIHTESSFEHESAQRALAGPNMGHVVQRSTRKEHPRRPKRTTTRSRRPQIQPGKSTSVPSPAQDSSTLTRCKRRPTSTTNLAKSKPMPASCTGSRSRNGTLSGTCPITSCMRNGNATVGLSAYLQVF